MVPPSEQDDLRSGQVTSERRLAFALPAEPVAAALTRTRLGEWLSAQDWPLAQADDVVLAVSEAVSNGVEHGYGVRPGVAARAGVVEVDAQVVACGDGMRRLEITVHDHGGWQVQAHTHAHRRHGIPIMKACVAEFAIDGTASGTTVVLRSRPVPA
ncbi:MAG TPA: ATP-binding protein [Pseudonocardia sp.]